MPDQPVAQTRYIGSQIIGITIYDTLVGDEAWHQYLDKMFGAIERGYRITFWNTAIQNDSKSAKETQTYSTASRDSAYRWGERMYDQGYTVSVVYDRTTGRYNCTASTVAVVVSTYTPQPLDTYLPGTWVIDSTVEVEGLDHIHFDSRIFDNAWEGYFSPNDDTLIFTTDSLYSNAMAYLKGVAESHYAVFDSMHIAIDEWGGEEIPLPIIQINNDSMLLSGGLQMYSNPWQEEWFYLYKRIN